MESSALFWTGTKERNFPSLVYIQQIENRELFHSVCFFHSSILYTRLLFTMHFSSVFSKHSLVSHKIISSAVWVFESMSCDHLSSPIHTQSHWFSWFCTFTAGAPCYFEQFAVCPFCGVVWLLSLPSQPKEKRAGHKKLFGLWEKFCLPNSLKEGCVKMGFSENRHSLSPGSHQSLVSSDSWCFLLLSDHWK